MGYRVVGAEAETLRLIIAGKETTYLGCGECHMGVEYPHRPECSQRRGNGDSVQGLRDTDTERGEALSGVRGSALHADLPRWVEAAPPRADSARPDESVASERLTTRELYISAVRECPVHGAADLEHEWHTLGKRPGAGGGSAQDAFARLVAEIRKGAFIPPGAIFTCDTCQRSFLRHVRA